MTRLSVNINKVATLRNARGGDVPNVVKEALDCEDFGADGITVHPATIVAVLLNVRFPAVDACPIGIIADAANAKAFSCLLYTSFLQTGCPAKKKHQVSGSSRYSIQGR